jgi:hypothetical protein
MSSACEHHECFVKYDERVTVEIKTEGSRMYLYIRLQIVFLAMWIMLHYLELHNKQTLQKKR